MVRWRRGEVLGFLVGAATMLSVHYAVFRGDLWVTQNAMATDLRSCQEKLVRLPPGTFHIEGPPWGDGGVLIHVAPSPEQK